MVLCYVHRIAGNRPTVQFTAKLTISRAQAYLAFFTRSVKLRLAGLPTPLLAVIVMT